MTILENDVISIVHISSDTRNHLPVFLCNLHRVEHSTLVFSDEVLNIGINLFSGNGVDIVLDYAGLIKSENILQGYIPLEKLEAYEEYIHLENSAIESQNTELEIIRGCQTNVIKSTLKSPEKYFDDVESVSDLLVILKAELKARGLYNRVRLLVGNGIDKMLFWLKNYRIIRLVKRCAADNI